MRAPLAAAIILSACGQAHEYEVYGIPVYVEVENGPTQAEVKELVTATIEGVHRGLSDSRKQIKEWLHRISGIVFSAGPFKGSEPDRLISGLYYPQTGMINVWHWHTCLAKSSLVHEILHHIELMRDGVANYTHVGYMWQMDGVCDTIEQDTIAQFCAPEDTWILE